MNASIDNGYIIIDNMYEDRHVIAIDNLVRAVKVEEGKHLPMIMFTGSSAKDLIIASVAYEKRMVIFEGKEITRGEDKAYMIRPRGAKGFAAADQRYVIDLNAMELFIDDGKKCYGIPIKCGASLSDISMHYYFDEEEIPEPIDDPES